MSKNNPLKNTTPKNCNYKLYKSKKQWITACATFLLTFGASAVVTTSAQAADDPAVSSGKVAVAVNHDGPNQLAGPTTTLQTKPKADLTNVASQETSRSAASQEKASEISSTAPANATSQEASRPTDSQGKTSKTSSVITSDSKPSSSSADKGMVSTNLMSPVTTVNSPAAVLANKAQTNEVKELIIMALHLVN